MLRNARLHLGRGNTRKSYRMGNADLREVVEEIDLGIIMDRELSFHMYFLVQVTKANKILGQIK